MLRKMKLQKGPTLEGPGRFGDQLHGVSDPETGKPRQLTVASGSAIGAYSRCGARGSSAKKKRLP